MRISAVLVACIGLLLPSSLIAQTAKDYIIQGWAKQQQGDNDSAIALYTQALALDPSSFVAYGARGLAKDSKGDFDGAISDYNHAIQLNSSSELDYEGRADSERHKGDFHGAIADYDQAIKLDPTRDAAYVERGQCKEKIEDNSGAYGDYSQAIRIKPSPLPYILRGRIELNANRLDSASSDLSKAIELNIDNSEFLYLHGSAEWDLGRATRDSRYFDIAIASFTKAIYLAPNEPDSYNGLGLAKVCKGDLAGAIVAFERAIHLNPRFAEAYFNMGLLEQAEGNTSLASQFFDQAIALNHSRATPSINPSTPNNEESVSFGTGFFITPSGYILTDFHVVKGASVLRVKIGKNILMATLVAKDTDKDVAVLKVDGSSYKCLPLGDSSQVQLGQSVFTIGFPNPEVQGFGAKLTKGEISSLTGEQDDPRMFQISVPVQPGNSGGCLVDENGNVIGLIEATLGTVEIANATGTLPQNVNYATKISYALSLLSSIPEAKSALATVGTTSMQFKDEVPMAVNATVFIIAANH